MTSAISPLQIDQLSRDTWGMYDAQTVAQLASLALEDCYQQKFYKFPDPQSEVFNAYEYKAYGLKITPGSLIYGVYLPALATGAAALFNVQITDQTLQHKFWDEPIPSVALANLKPTALSLFLEQLGSFPNLFNCIHPVIGDGLFLCEIWETSGAQQRIEVVLGVLEVVG